MMELQHRAVGLIRILAEILPEPIELMGCERDGVRPFECQHLGQVPNQSRAVAARRGEAGSVGRERQRADRAVMAAKASPLFARLHIPKMNGLLMLTAPGKRAAVRRKRHFIETAADLAMPALLARDDVP